MIHMRKRCLFICLLAAMMMLFISVASADTGTVTATSLILREEANSNSKALQTLRQGTKVDILSKTGSWYKVSYGKHEGYVYATYIQVTEEAKSSDRLVKGDKGTAVKELQKRLTELGYYSSTCDGNFGEVTEKAVKAFQKKNGLTQDGVAGPVTMKKMESSSAIKADGTKASASSTESTKADGSLQKGDKGTEVKKLQQRLKELGYYNYGIDSSYGDRTVEAVKAFQKKNGLTQDGVAGPVTLKKLNSSSAVPAKDPVVQEPEKEEEKDDGTLEKGDNGAAVKKLQQRLKELGYYTYGIDSSYGYRTVEAVKAFQKRNGLTQDGVAGPTTQTKLYSDSAVPAKDPVVQEPEKEEEKDDGTLENGDKGDAVKKLQQRLKELGYYTYGIDSSYGYRTVEAVKAFQKRNGLTQDGVAGPTTQTKLYSDSAVPAKDPVVQEPEKEEEKDDGTLENGDKGDAVKKLQQRLKELGYYTYGIDSSYGYRTVEAVKAFQKRNGLTQDGIAGPTTQTKLYSDSAVPAKDPVVQEPEKEEEKDDGTLEKGDKGDAVKKLQQRLKELGYYTYGIDSSYGDRTVEAVKAFQKKNNLTVDGIAGPTTQTKLYSNSAVGAKENVDVTLVTNQTLKKGDSGAQVKALQTRLKELGYYNTTIDGDYGYRTASAVSDFQRLNGLNVTGTADSTTLKKLVSSNAMTKAEAEKAEQEKEETYVTERLDWFNGGRAVFANRPIIEIKDVSTGLVFKGKVLYGTNHLDVEPLTAADTAILLKINGGVEFSWRRRAMLVKINGHVYASSIYSVPHGEQTITNNNFDGQFCLHFYGSMTHGTDVVDSDHQACVAQAMKATW